MKMMRRRRVLLRRVAAQAHLAPRRAELEAVRVVAVRAGHAPTEHLGLQKRAVFVHLVANLSVGVVETVLQERHAMSATEPPAVDVILGALPAARVAAPAHLDLALRPASRAAPGVGRFRADGPGDAPAIVQRNGEPFRAPHQALPVPSFRAHAT
jgi:hypothetical protein